MRLVCPNCGAQYEVPDQVIPLDGRDVQCSNCGTTWFQDHPDNPGQATEQEAVVSPDLGEAEYEEEEAETWQDDAAQEPDHDSQQAWHDEHAAEEYPDEDAVGGDELYEHAPSLDRDVADVLREEAEREARLRAAEDVGGLESQPDLGLDDVQDDARRRAEEARARMARLRGQPAAEPVETDETDMDREAISRRGLLPDIDEINSSLKTTSNAVAPALPRSGETGDAPQRKRGGFSRGFALVLLLGVILLLLYTNAPRISASVPQADPMINAYVAFIDNARAWLDQQMGRLTPK